MRFARFQNSKIGKGVALAIISAALSTTSYAATSTTTTQGGLSISVDSSTLSNLSSSIPNYGGTFVPGIGQSISYPGIPTVDVANTAQKLLNRVQDAYNYAQKLLTDNAITQAMGLAGQNKVDAVNNGASNMIVRVNKAVEDEANMDAVKNSMSSIDACRDIALSLGGKMGSGCDTLNTIRDSYLGRVTSSGSSALMTIAKGLNGNFSSAQSTDIARVGRIIKKYKADSESANPIGVYDTGRFSDPNVTTYDSDQVADLPDFLYIQIRPYAASNKKVDTMSVDSVSGATTSTDETKKTLDKSLVADVMADSYLDKVPGDGGISPYEAMKEFSKGKNSTEYTQKIETSQELSPVLLNRERAIMMAFNIHNKVTQYERSLKMEQISARELSEMVEQNDSNQ